MKAALPFVANVSRQNADGLSATGDASVKESIERNAKINSTEDLMTSARPQDSEPMRSESYGEEQNVCLAL